MSGRSTETSTGEDERALIEAAKRDPGRFADLYELNFDRVYAYISRRVRDRTDTVIGIAPTSRWSS